MQSRSRLVLSLALCAGAFLALAEAGPKERTSWAWYLGDPQRTHYSDLDQINTKNVSRLEQAWVYRSGGEAQIQCNPIVVKGLLFGVSAERRIFALNAATGKEVWTFAAPDRQASSSVAAWYWSRVRQRIMAGLGHTCIRWTRVHH